MSYFEKTEDALANALRGWPTAFGVARGARGLLTALLSGTLNSWKRTVYARWSYRQWRVKSPEQLRQQQWLRFGKILGHAYRNVPYYTQKFDAAGFKPGDIRSPDDLPRIPLLAKDDIRQAFPDNIVDRRASYKPYRVERTSGTTGESLHYIVHPTWNRNVLLYLSSLDYRPRYGRIGILTTPHCSPYTCSLTRTDMTPQERMAAAMARWPALRHLDARVSFTSSTRIIMESDQYMRSLHAQLLEAQPRILMVDPVYLAAFAMFLNRAGLSAGPFKFIVSSYELLTPPIRRLLERTFRCPVFVQYGCSEVGDIAGECREGRLHVRMDLVFVEVLRDDNTPAAPGELGRVVLTDLRNTVMPFIRYEVGDVARLSATPCPCGLRSMSLDSVEGRRRDLIKRVDGTIMTPLEASAIFEDMNGLEAYRLVQKDSSRYRISLLAREKLSNGTLEQVEARARDALGAGARVQVRQVHEIRAEGSNKYRFVYSEET